MAKFHNIKVEEIRKETADTVSVKFDVPDDLIDDFKYTSGQYLTLKMKVNGEEIRRSYSLCSDWNYDHEHRIAVKLVEGGKMSTFINEELKVGDEIEVSEPEGRFVPEIDESEARQHVFFAGGSGITPVLSMLKNILRSEPNSQCVLFYINSNESTVIFRDELNKLIDEYPVKFQVYHILSKPNNRDAHVDDYGEWAVGRVDYKKALHLIREFTNLESEPIFYLCGPNGLMDSVKTALDTARVGSDRVKMEYFSTPEQEPESAEKEDSEDMSPVESKATILLDDEEYEVTVPAGSTILDAANDQGVDAPYSCRGATCSTCMAKIEKGKAVMRMNYVLLDDEIEEGFVLTCQAQPVTPEITVDYDA